jgi:hypothetical protein
LEGSDSEAETAAAEGQQQGAAGSKAANGTNPAPAGKGGKQAASGGKKGWMKAGKAAAGPVLKSIVADLVPYGPAVAEHCCHLAGLSPQHPLASQPLSEGQILALHKAVQQFEAWLAGLDQGDQAEGFITAVPTAASKAKQQQQQQGGEGVGDKEKDAGEGEKVGLVYQEYNPLRLQGGKGTGGEVLTFTCFDDALDEYYGKVREWQGQGLQKRWNQRGEQDSHLCALLPVSVDMLLSPAHVIRVDANTDHGYSLKDNMTYISQTNSFRHHCNPGMVQCLPRQLQHQCKH